VIGQIIKINKLLNDPQILCGVIAVEKDAYVDFIKFSSSLPNVAIVNSEPHGNEWATLSRLHDDCSRRWDTTQPILYCHTKGAYSSSLQPAIIASWREWMEYFAFFRHRDALQCLDDGYTVYGFDAWVAPRRPLMRRLGFKPRFRFFSGNYWWSTAGSVRKISLVGIPFDRRHSAEGDFLSRIPRIRHFEALKLIGLDSIFDGAYTNYNDNFLHFHRLSEKLHLLEDMRIAIKKSR